ncbi:hypothetical protein [Actinoplanes sp. URMC 104]|uniref:hypothetical protein n=1 Tax=Actinoplanes sp. URMC 104 TaxID=3423409 RepID=UPI003F1CE1B8
MMRREVPTRTREAGSRAGDQIADMHIELAPSDHEEPTWEVRSPEAAGRKRRLDRRTRMILGVAAVLAVVVNAGAAWVYWRISDTEVAQPADGPPIELALRARSDLNNSLTRGTTGDLVVTVTNDNSFPIKITSVVGDGRIVANPEHARAGCAPTGVRLSRQQFEVVWEVDRNTIGAFNVPGGLTMRPDAKAACEHATFTVPVRVFGVRQESS